ncbi:MAG TPA: hypothetical protein P5279_14070 [Anaerohalosphaeraceae bacterium]|jgi:hypothetical protein|nr:hypothetical protein [Anaerohalosphaeraceae bacterium]HRT51616.1 hypothetical protein [Anaerohalosphaeraceae bacterium]HRT87632.1 hypothetical protein [Anaerohalosphaeraceae bacterium]
MLSFEVNTTLFDNEIDRAIDMLYLGHWIGKVGATQTQKRNALLELRAQLVEEKDTAIAEYDQAMLNLNTPNSGRRDSPDDGAADIESGVFAEPARSSS